MPNDYLQYGFGGLLFAVLMAIGRGAVIVYRDIMKPMAARHMEFTQSIEMSSSKMADSTEELVEANKIQVELLKEVRDKQAQMCRWHPSVNGREV